MVAANSGTISCNRPISLSHRRPNEGRALRSNIFSNSFSIRSRETPLRLIVLQISFNDASGIMPKRLINCITRKRRNGSSLKNSALGARNILFSISFWPSKGSMSTPVFISMPIAFIVKSRRAKASSVAINGSIFTSGLRPGLSVRGNAKSMARPG